MGQCEPHVLLQTVGPRRWCGIPSDELGLRNSPRTQELSWCLVALAGLAQRPFSSAGNPGTLHCCVLEGAWGE